MHLRQRRPVPALGYNETFIHVYLSRLTPFALSKPFLKWAGGKTRLAPLLAKAVPGDVRRYFEPFLGSGALFFALRPRVATLSDSNEDLIVCYQEVRRDPLRVLNVLRGWPNDPDMYREVRDLAPVEMDAVERAARVLYLNRTAFRGLWRVNKHGQFNVPYGNYSRPLWYREELVACAEALRNRRVLCKDFREIAMQAQHEDFVFFDPPYLPAGEHADFRRYTRERFYVHDHHDLVEICKVLTDRGVRFALTNIDNPATRRLYEGHEFRMYSYPAQRSIRVGAAGRSRDLIVTNYDAPPLAEAVATAPGATEALRVEHAA